MNAAPFDAEKFKAAARIGANGFALATDLSPAILEFAEANARRAGYANVETQAADGENLKVEDASFNAAICRLGLMFYPDPSKGCARCSTRSSRAGS